MYFPFVFHEANGSLYLEVMIIQLDCETCKTLQEIALLESMMMKLDLYSFLKANDLLFPVVETKQLDYETYWIFQEALSLDRIN